MARGVHAALALLAALGLAAETARAASGDDAASEDDLLRWTADASPTGAAIFSIPIVVPPGRQGVEPRLALTYSSQGGPSVFGLGWSMNLPRIQYSTRFGVPKSLATVPFELDGQVLVETPGGSDSEGSYREFRTRRESFRRARYYTGANRWLVTEPNGARLRFGTDPGSRRGGSPTKIWALDRMVDPHGNTLLVSYQKPASEATPDGPDLELRPYRIEYTLHSSDGGIQANAVGTVRKLELAYSQLPGHQWRHEFRSAQGAATVIAHRIAAIRVWHGSTLVRKYEFGFDPAQNAIHTLLTSVQLRADEAGGLVYPPWEFDYQPETRSFATVEATLTSLPGELSSWDPMPASGTVRVHGQYASLLDVNRDGLLDRLDQRSARLGEGAGFGGTISNWFTGFSGSNCSGGSRFYSLLKRIVVLSNTTRDADACLYTDANGDGYPDLISAQVSCDTTRCDEVHWDVYNGGPGGVTAALPHVAWDNPEPLDRDTLDNWPYPTSGLAPQHHENSAQGDGVAGLRATFLDMNGDGHADRIVSSTEDLIFRVYLNNGAGWGNTPDEWTNPSQTGLGDAYGDSLQVAIPGRYVADLIDMNGDGLPDRVVSEDLPNLPRRMLVYWNRGTSFSGTPLVLDSGSELAYGTRAYGSSGVVADLVDVNGDRLPDRVEASATSLEVWFNTGNGLAPDPVPWTLPAGTQGVISGVMDETSAEIAFLDLDGDGLKERVVSSGAGTGPWTQYGMGHEHRPYLMALATTPLGAVVELRYESSLRQRDAITGQQLDALGLPGSHVDDADPNLGDFAEPVPVLVEQKTCDGPCDASPPPAWTSTTKHAYRGFRYDYAGKNADTLGRELRGVRFHEATTYRNASDANRSIRREWYHQGDALAGRLARVQELAGDDVLREVTNTWTRVDGGSVGGSTTGAWVARLDRVETREASAVAPWVQALTTRILGYGAYNAVVSERIEAADDGNSSLVVTRGYPPVGDAWIAGLPAWEKVEEESAPGGTLTRLSHAKFRYDDGGEAVAPTRGQLTLVQRVKHAMGAPPPPGSEAWTTEGFGYHASYGNLLWHVDANLHATFYCWDGMTSFAGVTCAASQGLDSSWTHRVGVLNAKSQQTVHEWDARFGVETQTTDVYGVRTRRVLDGLGRLKEVWTRGRGVASSGEELRSSYDYAPDLRRITTRRYADSSTALVEEQHLDALGRQVRVVRPGDDGRRIGIELGYDFRGSLAESTAPYFCSDTPCVAAASVARTRRSYDALGRMTSETYPLPDGETGTRAIAYGDTDSARWQWLTRGDLSVRGVRFDWAGRPLEIKESAPVSGPAVETTYGYWQNGALTSIQVAGETPTTMSYDTLGRRTGLVDPDAGPQGFVFDDVGNLVEHRNARMQTTRYRHDDIDRVYSIEPEGAGRASSTLTWDTGSGPGRLHSVVTGGHSTELAYDRYGRLEQDIQRVGDVLYYLRYGYDLLDRPTWVRYPDDTYVAYQYDGPALEKACRSSMASCGSGLLERYVSDATYDAFGGLATLHAAPDTGPINGIFTRDPGSGLLTDHGFVIPSVPWLSTRYWAFDREGRAQRASDSLAGEYDSFAFDRLGRLAGHDPNGSTTPPANYGYSNAGDLLKHRSLTQNMCYGAGCEFPAKPHQAVLVQNSYRYKYDADGNVSERHSMLGAVRTFTHASDGTLTSISGDGVTATFLYDHTGQRVEKAAAGKRLVYSPDGLFEYDPVAKVGALHVYFAGQRLATTTVGNLELVPGGGCAGGPGALVPVEPGDLAPLGAVLVIAFGARWARRVRFARPRSWAQAAGNGSVAICFFTAAVTPVPGRAIPRTGPTSPVLGTVYYVADPLGSVRRAVKPGGEFVTHRYFPFGESNGSTGSLIVDFRFTGQVHDDETGLYYWNARYYDPIAGRFLEPDPIVANVYDPQSMNPYTYARNDPIDLIDPSGMWWLSDLVRDIGGWLGGLLGATGALPQISATIEIVDGIDALTSFTAETGYSRETGRSGVEIPSIAMEAVRSQLSQGQQYPADLVGPLPPGDALSEIPGAPPDASVDQNIADIIAIRGDAGGVTAGAVWLQRVWPGGDWDYKSRPDGRRYENFGNFNYGATGRALGLSRETILRGAGAAQLLAEGAYHLRNGTPLGGPPYGDNPEDQPWIQRGIDYYDRRWGLR